MAKQVESKEKAAEKKKAQADRLAESLKEQERRREEIKFQEEWNKRVVIAREGRVAYERNDPATAVINYKKILSLTARRHNCSVENLHPSMFDASSRISESLLLSALLFDLAKIIERLDGDQARRDLMTYLKLFVVFSKGMPFEVVAFSSIRKYVEFSHGLKHPAEFRAAYNSMKKRTCFVATAVFESPTAPEVIKLKAFRDERLSPRLLGRAFIQFYWWVGPSLAQIVEFVPSSKAPLRKALRSLVRRLP